MAWYQFKGSNSLGNPVQGKYNTDSTLTLMNRLQSAGISSVSIEKMNVFQAIFINVKNIVSRFFPVKKTELALFYDQLANLLEVEIPIKHALFIIVSYLNNPRLVRIIHDLINHLSRGASFSESLRQHQGIFSSETVRLISFAQSKEELIAILRYCDQAMQRLTFMKRVFFVIMPQCSLTMVFFVALLFLRERYLASFNYAIYVYKQSVPTVIRIFDVVTGLFTTHIIKTIIFFLLSAFAIKLLISFSQKVRFFYHTILCYFPVISGVILATERERLSLLYSVLLKGGASAQKCAQCGVAVVGNLFFRRRVKSMSIAVQQGESFSNVLRFFRIFNAAEVQMISLGAVSNSLVKAFERIYSLCQIMLERRLLMLIEFARLLLYIFNTVLFFFVIYVAETLFYYPGAVS